MCQNGSTINAELYISENCDVPMMALFIIQCSGIGLSVLAFIVSAIMLLVRWDIIMRKKIAPKIFSVWSCFQHLVMTVRPSVMIILHSYAWQNLWHLYIINMSAYLGAGTVILFVYIQVKLVKNSELRKQQKKIYKHFIRFLYTLPIIQLVLYGLAPIGFYLSFYSSSMAFWVPTLVIVILIIPPLTIYGLISYCRIRKMQDESYRPLGQRILIMVIVCTILGSAVGVVAVLSFFPVSFNWIIVEMTWNFYTLFNFILFNLVTKEQIKNKINKITSGSRQSETPTTKYSTNSTIN